MKMLGVQPIYAYEKHRCHFVRCLSFVLNIVLSCFVFVSLSFCSQLTELDDEQAKPNNRTQAQIRMSKSQVVENESVNDTIRRLFFGFLLEKKNRTKTILIISLLFYLACYIITEIYRCHEFLSKC